MNGSQSIERPWGASVFGAASVEAVPDVAWLRMGIRQTRQEPGEAFAVTRAGVNSVREVLRGHGVPDSAVSTSRLNLKSSWEYGSPRKFLGYECTASFMAELRDLDILERVLVDAVAAGANEVEGVEFDVSGKKELRAQARRAAVAAAREKALLYAEAAGVGLGPVVHIKDVYRPPNAETAYRRHSGAAEMDGGDGDLRPGTISVTANVVVGYSLGRA